MILFSCFLLNGFCCYLSLYNSPKLLIWIHDRGHTWPSHSFYFSLLQKLLCHFRSEEESYLLIRYLGEPPYICSAIYKCLLLYSCSPISAHSYLHDLQSALYSHCGGRSQVHTKYSRPHPIKVNLFWFHLTQEYAASAHQDSFHVLSQSFRTVQFCWQLFSSWTLYTEADFIKSTIMHIV